MKVRLLELLACPACGGNVRLAREDTVTDVESGTLVCVGCTRSYPIIHGIPRMLPDEGVVETVKSFEIEFSSFGSDDLDMDPYELRRFYFFSRTGVDQRLYEHGPSDHYPTDLPDDMYEPDGAFLVGRATLDAGCGPGRFTEVAAREGADYVVGLDLGGHVERAAARCRHLGNVDFVQGSVLRPPFRGASFDYVFSIGVLHHTSDPRRAFGALADLVNERGAFSVWVYSAEYWGRNVRSWIAKKLHRWMSRLAPDRARMIAQRLLYPLGIAQSRLARVRVLKWVFAPIFVVPVPRHPRKEVMLATILDYYTPRYISVHAPSEIAKWAREEKFKNIELLPVPTSCLARRA